MGWDFYDKFGQRRATATQIPGATTLIKDRGLVNILNSSALTPVFSQSIPAGSMGLTSTLRAKLIGDWKDNAGSNQGLRTQITLGGVVLYDGINGSLAANSTNRSPVRMEFTIMTLNSLTSVYLNGHVIALDGTNGVPTTGIGAFTNVGAGAEIASLGAITVPTLASAQTLAINVALSAASALLDFNKYAVDAEIF